jgi:glycerol-1-phosphate dehydrogenase [NAD(P)+]
LPGGITSFVRSVLSEGAVAVVGTSEVSAGSLEESRSISNAFRRVAADGVIAVGGGRSLDVGKHVSATLSGDSVEGSPGEPPYSEGSPEVPVLCVPTSLSNDGFASPTASLVDDSLKRVTLNCDGPTGVIVDTEICGSAPHRLLAAGLGDIMAKVSAIADYRLLEHAGTGQYMDGIAVTIAESSVSEACGIEKWDAEGVLRLGRGLLLGGIAIGVAGGSRPCSGSEHLISHALDRLRSPAGSHGIQVGLAAYVTSILHNTGGDAVLRRVYDRLGFWQHAAEEVAAGLTQARFIESLAIAPEIKPGYLTVLSRPGATEEVGRILASDPVLQWWRDVDRS